MSSQGFVFKSVSQQLQGQRHVYAVYSV